MSEKRKYRLSPSKLTVFIKCPRCFWLDVNEKKARPRGMFPSLPNGIDRVVKEHFDRCRVNKDVPREMKGSVSGMLYQDAVKLKKWRHWKSGMSYVVNDQLTIFGALDDVFQHDNSAVSPIDYKTKGTKPIPQYVIEWYRHQLDTYGLLLQAEGLSVASLGYLMYYWPKDCEPVPGSPETNKVVPIMFDTMVIPVEINSQRALKLYLDAVDCLNGPIPKASCDCEYCKYIDSMTPRVTKAEIDKKLSGIRKQGTVENATKVIVQPAQAEGSNFPVQAEAAKAMAQQRIEEVPEGYERIGDAIVKKSVAGESGPSPITDESVTSGIDKVESTVNPKVFFEVDLTIWDEACKKPRPGLLEVFTKLRDIGCNIYLWSKAGPTHCRKFLEQNSDFALFIKDVYAKPCGNVMKNKKGVDSAFKKLGIPFKPDYCVDSGGAYLIKLFKGSKMPVFKNLETLEAFDFSIMYKALEPKKVAALK